MNNWPSDFKNSQISLHVPTKWATLHKQGWNID